MAAARKLTAPAPEPALPDALVAPREPRKRRGPKLASADAAPGPNAVAEQYARLEAVFENLSDEVASDVVEPEVSRYHGAVRVAVLLGSSVGLWALLIAAAQQGLAAIR